MSLPRVSLSSAGIGLGLGAAFGLAMGGPTGAGLGAVAGLALAAAPERKKRAEKTTERRAPSQGEARERRRVFLRGLASSKPDAVEKLATYFRHVGALVAARALRQHAADLRSVAAKSVDEKLVASFDEKLALVREEYADDSPEVKSAQANVDAARAANGAENRS